MLYTTVLFLHCGVWTVWGKW